MIANGARMEFGLQFLDKNALHNRCHWSSITYHSFYKLSRGLRLASGWRESEWRDANPQSLDHKTRKSLIVGLPGCHIIIIYEILIKYLTGEFSKRLTRR